MVRFYTTVKTRTLVKKPTYLNVNNGIPIVVQGERLKFEGGELFLTEKEQIDFIRNHKDFGICIFEDVEQAAKPKVKAKV